MYTSKIILIISFITCVALSSDSQSIWPSVIDVAGTNVTAAGITHEYAIGQVTATPTYSIADLLVTPGLVQPQFNPTGVSTLHTAITGLSVFPNPASALIYLQPAFSGAQGIARNAADAPLASKTLGVRITIHDGSATGSTVYQEIQVSSTNAYGLYNITIGSGTVITGTFADINCAIGSKYIQVEMDAGGGIIYADLGTCQHMSLSYAMSTASAPAPILNFRHDTLTAGANFVKLPATNLTLIGTTLTAGGNSITLPVYTAGSGIAVSGTNVISANNLAGDVIGASSANTDKIYNI